ncbi:Myb-like DNA-binding domain protein [Cooperia oncophora]
MSRSPSRSSSRTSGSSCTESEDSDDTQESSVFDENIDKEEIMGDAVGDALSRSPSCSSSGTRGNSCTIEDSDDHSENEHEGSILDENIGEENVKDDTVKEALSVPKSPSCSSSGTNGSSGTESEDSDDRQESSVPDENMDKNDDSMEDSCGGTSWIHLLLLLLTQSQRNHMCLWSLARTTTMETCPPRRKVAQAGTILKDQKNEPTRCQVSKVEPIRPNSSRRVIIPKAHFEIEGWHDPQGSKNEPTRARSPSVEPARPKSSRVIIPKAHFEIEGWHDPQGSENEPTCAEPSDVEPARPKSSRVIIPKAHFEIEGWHDPQGSENEPTRAKSPSVEPTRPMSSRRVIVPKAHFEIEGWHDPQGSKNERTRIKSPSVEPGYPRSSRRVIIPKAHFDIEGWHESQTSTVKPTRPKSSSIQSTLGSSSNVRRRPVTQLSNSCGYLKILPYTLFTEPRNMASSSGGPDVMDIIYCINCRQQIQSRLHVKCCECPAMMCAECFSYGCEAGQHVRGHNYEICDPLGGRTFDVKGSWGAVEERKLLAAAYRFKLGNWGEVTRLMETERSISQVQEYYDRFFIRGPIGQFALKLLNWEELKRAMLADGSLGYNCQNDRITYLLMAMDAYKESKEKLDPHDDDLGNKVDAILQSYLFRLNLNDERPQCSEQSEMYELVDLALSDDSCDPSDYDMDKKAPDDAYSTGLEPENDSEEDEPNNHSASPSKSSKVEPKSLRKSLRPSVAFMRATKKKIRCGLRKSTLEKNGRASRYRRVQADSSSTEDDSGSEDEVEPMETDQTSVDDAHDSLHGLEKEDSSVRAVHNIIRWFKGNNIVEAMLFSYDTSLQDDCTGSDSEEPKQEPVKQSSTPFGSAVRRRKRAKLVSKKARRLKEFQKRMARMTKAAERRLHELSELCPIETIRELRNSKPDLALYTNDYVGRPKVRQSDMDMLAYNAARGDFEWEWYNDAEQLISRLMIQESSDRVEDLENDIKFARIEKYYRILKTRKAYRRAIVEHDKISEFFRFMMNMTMEKRKASQILAQRPPLEKLLTRAQQCLTKKETEDLRSHVERADELMERIAKLQELQRNGVLTLKEAVFLVVVLCWIHFLMDSLPQLLFLSTIVELYYMKVLSWMHLLKKLSKCNGRRNTQSRRVLLSCSHECKVEELTYDVEVVVDNPEGQLQSPVLSLKFRSPRSGTNTPLRRFRHHGRVVSHNNGGGMDGSQQGSSADMSSTSQSSGSYPVNVDAVLGANTVEDIADTHPDFARLLLDCYSAGCDLEEYKREFQRLKNLRIKRQGGVNQTLSFSLFPSVPSDLPGHLFVRLLKFHSLYEGACRKYLADVVNRRVEASPAFPYDLSSVGIQDLIQGGSSTEYYNTGSGTHSVAGSYTGTGAQFVEPSGMASGTSSVVAYSPAVNSAYSQRVSQPGMRNEHLGMNQNMTVAGMESATCMQRSTMNHLHGSMSQPMGTAQYIDRRMTATPLPSWSHHSNTPSEMRSAMATPLPPLEIRQCPVLQSSLSTPVPRAENRPSQTPMTQHRPMATPIPGMESGQSYSGMSSVHSQHYQQMTSSSGMQGNIIADRRMMTSTPMIGGNLDSSAQASPFATPTKKPRARRKPVVTTQTQVQGQHSMTLQGRQMTATPIPGWQQHQTKSNMGMQGQPVHVQNRSMMSASVTPLQRQLTTPVHDHREMMSATPLPGWAPHQVGTSNSQVERSPLVSSLPPLSQFTPVQPQARQLKTPYPTTQSRQLVAAVPQTQQRAMSTRPYEQSSHVYPQSREMVTPVPFAQPESVSVPYVQSQNMGAQMGSTTAEMYSQQGIQYQWSEGSSMDVYGQQGQFVQQSSYGQQSQFTQQMNTGGQQMASGSQQQVSFVANPAVQYPTPAVHTQQPQYPQSSVEVQKGSAFSQPYSYVQQSYPVQSGSQQQSSYSQDSNFSHTSYTQRSPYAQQQQADQSQQQQNQSLSYTLQQNLSQPAQLQQQQHQHHFEQQQQQPVRRQVYENSAQYAGQYSQLIPTYTTQPACGMQSAQLTPGSMQAHQMPRSCDVDANVIPQLGSDIAHQDPQSASNFATGMLDMSGSSSTGAMVELLQNSDPMASGETLDIVQGEYPGMMTTAIPGGPMIDPMIDGSLRTFDITQCPPPPRNDSEATVPARTSPNSCSPGLTGDDESSSLIPSIFYPKEFVQNDLSELRIEDSPIEKSIVNCQHFRFDIILAMKHHRIGKEDYERTLHELDEMEKEKCIGPLGDLLMKRLGLKRQAQYSHDGKFSVDELVAAFAANARIREPSAKIPERRMSSELFSEFLDDITPVQPNTSVDRFQVKSHPDLHPISPAVAPSVSKSSVLQSADAMNDLGYLLSDDVIAEFDSMSTSTPTTAKPLSVGAPSSFDRSEPVSIGVPASVARSDPLSVGSPATRVEALFDKSRLSNEASNLLSSGFNEGTVSVGSISRNDKTNAVFSSSSDTIYGQPALPAKVSLPPSDLLVQGKSAEKLLSKTQLNSILPSQSGEQLQSTVKVNTVFTDEEEWWRKDDETPPMLGGTPLKIRPESLGLKSAIFEASSAKYKPSEEQSTSAIEKVLTAKVDVIPVKPSPKRMEQKEAKKESDRLSQSPPPPEPIHTKKFDEDEDDRSYSKAKITEHVKKPQRKTNRMLFGSDSSSEDSAKEDSIQAPSTSHAHLSSSLPSLPVVSRKKSRSPDEYHSPRSSSGKKKSRKSSLPSRPPKELKENTQKSGLSKLELSREVLAKQIAEIIEDERSKLPPEEAKFHKRPLSPASLDVVIQDLMQHHISEDTSPNRELFASKLLGTDIFSKLFFRAGKCVFRHYEELDDFRSKEKGRGRRKGPTRKRDTELLRGIRKSREIQKYKDALRAAKEPSEAEKKAAVERAKLEAMPWLARSTFKPDVQQGTSSRFVIPKKSSGNRSGGESSASRNTSETKQRETARPVEPVVKPSHHKVSEAAAEHLRSQSSSEKVNLGRGSRSPPSHLIGNKSLSRVIHEERLTKLDLPVQPVARKAEEVSVSFSFCWMPKSSTHKAKAKHTWPLKRWRSTSALIEEAVEVVADSALEQQPEDDSVFEDLMEDVAIAADSFAEIRFEKPPISVESSNAFQTTSFVSARESELAALALQEEMSRSEQASPDDQYDALRYLAAMPESEFSRHSDSCEPTTPAKITQPKLASRAGAVEIPPKQLSSEPLQSEQVHFGPTEWMRMEPAVQPFYEAELGNDPWRLPLPNTNSLTPRYPPGSAQSASVAAAENLYSSLQEELDTIVRDTLGDTLYSPTVAGSAPSMTRCTTRSEYLCDHEEWKYLYECAISCRKEREEAERRRLPPTEQVCSDNFEFSRKPKKKKAKFVWKMLQRISDGDQLSVIRTPSYRFTKNPAAESVESRRWIYQRTFASQKFSLVSTRPEHRELKRQPCLENAVVLREELQFRQDLCHFSGFAAPTALVLRSQHATQANTEGIMPIYQFSHEQDSMSTLSAPVEIDLRKGEASEEYQTSVPIPRTAIFGTEVADLSVSYVQEDDALSARATINVPRKTTALLNTSSLNVAFSAPEWFLRRSTCSSEMVLPHPRFDCTVLHSRQSNIERERADAYLSTSVKLPIPRTKEASFSHIEGGQGFTAVEPSMVAEISLPLPVSDVTYYKSTHLRIRRKRVGASASRDIVLPVPRLDKSVLSVCELETDQTREGFQEMADYSVPLPRVESTILNIIDVNLHRHRQGFSETGMGAMPIPRMECTITNILKLNVKRKRTGLTAASNAVITIPRMCLAAFSTVETESVHIREDSHQCSEMVLPIPREESTILRSLTMRVKRSKKPIAEPFSYIHSIAREDDTKFTVYDFTALCERTGDSKERVYAHPIPNTSETICSITARDVEMVNREVYFFDSKGIPDVPAEVDSSVVDAKQQLSLVQELDQYALATQSQKESSENEPISGKVNKSSSTVTPVPRRDVEVLRLSTIRLSRKRKNEEESTQPAKRMKVEERPELLTEKAFSSDANRFTEIVYVKDPRLPLQCSSSFVEVSKKWRCFAHQHMPHLLLSSYMVTQFATLLQRVFGGGVDRCTITMKDLNRLISNMDGEYDLSIFTNPEKVTAASSDPSGPIWDRLMKLRMQRNSTELLSRKALAPLYIFLGMTNLPRVGKPWRKWLKPIDATTESRIGCQLALCMRIPDLVGVDDMDPKLQAIKMWWTFMMIRGTLAWYIYPCFSRRQLFLLVRLLEALEDVERPPFCLYPPKVFFKAVKKILRHPRMDLIPKDIYHPDITTMATLLKMKRNRVFHVDRSLPELLSHWMDDMNKIDAYLATDVKVNAMKNSSFLTQGEWAWKNFGHGCVPDGIKYDRNIKVEKTIEQLTNCLADVSLSLEQRKQISVLRTALGAWSKYDSGPSIDQIPVDIINPFALSASLIALLPMPEGFVDECFKFLGKGWPPLGSLQALAQRPMAKRRLVRFSKSFGNHLRQDFSTISVFNKEESIALHSPNIKSSRVIGKSANEPITKPPTPSSKQESSIKRPSTALSFTTKKQAKTLSTVSGEKDSKATRGWRKRKDSIADTKPASEIVRPYKRSKTEMRKRRRARTSDEEGPSSAKQLMAKIPEYRFSKLRHTLARRGMETEKMLRETVLRAVSGNRINQFFLPELNPYFVKK